MEIVKVALTILISLIAGGNFFAVIIWLIFRNLGMGPVVSAYIGYISWAIIYGMSFEYFWIFVQANHSVILQDGSIAEKPEMVNDPTRIPAPKGQRAVFTGLNFKLPWESPYGEPIPLVKTTPLGSTVTAQAGGPNVIVKWEGALAPIPDQSLVWYYATDEAALIKLLNAKISGKLQSRIQQAKNPEEILDNVQEYFKLTLEEINRENAIEFEERRTARYISKLTIEDVQKEQTSQDIDERLNNAKKIAETVEEVLKKSGTNPLVQQMAVAAALGTTVKENTIALLNALGSNPGNKGKGNSKG